MDGNHTNPQTQLWMLRTTDGEAWPITEELNDNRSPSWSADGRTLYFVTNRAGTRDLWQQRLDDEGRPVGSPEALTVGVGMIHASFDPTGSRVSYSRGVRFQHVWRVPIFEDRAATWADAEQLTFDQAYVESIDLSPDGAMLVFDSNRSGNQDLWVMPASGDAPKQLTTDPKDDFGPRWSADGTEIVFYAYRSGNRDVWVMPAEGGSATQLTTNDNRDAFPDFSPDGRQVVFESRRDDARIHIWVLSRDDGTMRQITSGVGNEQFPDWSPDGEWIVFSGQNHFRIRPLGDDLEQLISTAIQYSRWSPDGQVLYYSNLSDGEFWELALETQQLRQVTELTGRPGTRGGLGLAVGDGHLYFMWRDLERDIWAMDVVLDE